MPYPASFNLERLKILRRNHGQTWTAIDQFLLLKLLADYSFHEQEIAYLLGRSYLSIRLTAINLINDAETFKPRKTFYNNADLSQVRRYASELFRRLNDHPLTEVQHYYLSSLLNNKQYPSLPTFNQLGNSFKDF